MISKYTTPSWQRWPGQINENKRPCILKSSARGARTMDGGNYGFSGEAAVALRLGPCSLDRPPAFFANTVEYHRRESLHHKVGFARVQGRGEPEFSVVREPR